MHIFSLEGWISDVLCLCCHRPLRVCLPPYLTGRKISLDEKLVKLLKKSLLGVGGCVLCHGLRAQGLGSESASLRNVFCGNVMPVSLCLQVERKRHIGNDIVTIVFQEGNDTSPSFKPSMIRSHFTRILSESHLFNDWELCVWLPTNMHC